MVTTLNFRQSAGKIVLLATSLWWNIGRCKSILVNNQIIKLKVNRTSLDHYIEKGYEVKVNQTIEVKAEDLTDSCGKKVEVVCDYCGKEHEKTFKKYLKGREFIEKDACQNCFPIKQKEVVQFRYGVDSTLQLPENKEKAKQTSLKNYGTENPFQSEVNQDKFKKTMLERHGVEYAQQSSSIREKTKETLIKNFGVENPYFIDGMKNKIEDNIKYVNGVKVSQSQNFIAYNVNGSLNTNLFGFFVDILIPKENIVIEYNGSGHYLSAEFGRTTIEEIKAKDKARTVKLNSEGYKCLVIENTKDRKISKVRMETIHKYIEEMINTNTNSTYYYDVS